MVSYQLVLVFFALTAVLFLAVGIVLFKPSGKKNTGGDPEQKKKISKLCLAGLILSALYPVLLAINYFVALFLPFSYFPEPLNPVLILLPVAGIIFSMAGLIHVRKSGKTGRKFAIAGIVLPGGYLVIALITVLISIVVLIVNNSMTVHKQEKREVYNMGYAGNPVNTEYDVSQYKIPEGFDFGTLDINTSESELKTYAESKLQTIDFVGVNSSKGKFRQADFLIVRSDRLDKWLKDNNLNNFTYSNGYATLIYDFTWEFAATGFNTLDVYKDPSGKFIIITNCSDYKVIAEFFEGIGEAVPTEESEEDYGDYEPPEKNEQLDFLENNINKDMSLLEIINVFEEMCDQLPDNDPIIFKYGVDYFSENYYHDSDSDDSNRTHYNDEQYFCFCLAREFESEDGKPYQIRVEILYGINGQNKKFDLTKITDSDVDGDFFDYILNTDAYNYAQTAQIKKLRIYMIEI